MSLSFLPSCVLCALLALPACAAPPTERSAEPAARRSEASVPSDIVRSRVFHATPAPAGAHYVRCGTHAGETVWHAELSRDHAYLAVRTNAGTVRLVATEGFREVAELGSSSGRIGATAFSPDGSLLATLSREDGQLALWRTRDGTLERSATVADAVGPTARWAAAGIAFTSDGRQVLTTAPSLTDVRTGETTRLPGVAYGHRAWLVDDRRLVVHGSTRVGVGEEWVLYFVDLDTERVVELVRAAGHHVRSRDGRILAVRGVQGTDVFDLGEHDPKAVHVPGPHDLLGVSDDGAQMYLHHEGVVMAYDAASGAESARFTWPRTTRFLGFAPGGELIGASDTETTWWDPGTGRSVRSVSESLTSVTYSADGRMGAGASAGVLVRVWDEESGSDLLRIPRPMGALPRLRQQLNLFEYLRRPLIPREVAPTTVSGDGQVAIYHQGFIRLLWFSRVYDRAGAVLHTFGVTNEGFDLAAEITPNGEVIFTSESEGLFPANPFQGTWCRVPAYARDALHPSLPDPVPDVTRSPSSLATPDVAIGEFSVELVHSTITSRDVEPSYATIYGAIYRAALPAPGATTRATSGPCALLSPHAPRCDACGPPSVCVADGACEERAPPLHVGAVTVKGVRSEAGQGTFTIFPTGHHYLKPGDRDLAYPPFADGDSVSFTTSGGDLEPLTLTGKGIAPLELVQREPLRRGEPFVVRWVPPRDPTAARVRMVLDLSPSLGGENVIACEGEDNGELVVSADLLDHLANLGISGYPTLTITRVGRTSVQTRAGRVDLRISSSHEELLRFKDLTSCADTGEFCPWVSHELCPEAPGLCPWMGVQVCRADRFCEPSEPEARRAYPTAPPNFRGLLSPAAPARPEPQWWTDLP